MKMQFRQWEEQIPPMRRADSANEKSIFRQWEEQIPLIRRAESEDLLWLDWTWRWGGHCQGGECGEEDIGEGGGGEKEESYEGSEVVVVMIVEVAVLLKSTFFCIGILPETLYFLLAFIGILGKILIL